MSEFTFETSFYPRYRDLDPNAHVNQAVYFSYLEQARTRYWQEALSIRHDRTPLAIVRQEIEYSAPVRIDQEVTVAQRIREIGESSLRVDYEVRTGEGVAATAEVVLVAIDRETGSSVPLDEDVRAAIADHEGLED